ncbi:rhomboid family intramembrane serine protease [Halorubrum vacuolatum]|uniref:rhomboid family intramembrane serine protease n=1 Tax=Halorubrum vacuolatum TaxID=63740 RepID=UPI0015C606C7|nr:rhomboid family intramembrane serine protease [Halorubrum vacuolatum]
MSLCFLAAFAWHVLDRDAWRERLTDRFVLGVPWGTLVTVAVVVGFYLFAQSGFQYPDAPVIYAFISWSYLYPTGILTAGIAHGGADHIVSNMTGTLVLAPIAEYVWGHYRGGSRKRAADSQADNGLLGRPWLRAVVVFPAALFAVAFLTAAFSLGPGLGFSGALYGIVGFAVVARPLATVVGVVATSAVGTIFTAFTSPLVRETLSVGPPAPPSWAGVGFQAHLLGFLIGALLAIALLSARGTRPRMDRVLGGTLVVGVVQSVWLLTGGGADEFVLYRGVGMTFLFGLTVLIALAAAGSARPLIVRVPLLEPSVSGAGSTSSEPSKADDTGAFEWVTQDSTEGDTPADGSKSTERHPSDTAHGKPRKPRVRRGIAAAWVVLVVLASALVAAASIALDEPAAISLLSAAILATLLSLPAIPAILPRRLHSGPLTRRGGAVLVIVGLTLLASLPMVVFGLLVVDDPSIEGSEAIEIGDYSVAYVDDEPAPQSGAIDLGEGFTGGTTDGVIVTSDEREMWTVDERPAVLAHEGETTVVVGGIGWREEVAVDRVAWDVVGNETAYAVDLEHDEEEIRSYVGDVIDSDSRVDGHALAVAPTDDGFEVRATPTEGATDGDATGDEGVGDAAEDPLTATVPEPGEEESLGDLRIRTVPVDGDGGSDLEDEDVDARLVVEGSGSTVVLAERRA